MKAAEFLWCLLAWLTQKKISVIFLICRHHHWGKTNEQNNWNDDNNDDFLENKTLLIIIIFFNCVFRHIRFIKTYWHQEWKHFFVIIKITDVAENKILLEASIEDILFLLNDKMEMYSRSSKHCLMDYHIQISSEKCRHEEKQNGNQYTSKFLTEWPVKPGKCYS